jgi:hypothetical protein
LCHWITGDSTVDINDDDLHTLPLHDDNCGIDLVCHDQYQSILIQHEDESHEPIVYPSHDDVNVAIADHDDDLMPDQVCSQHSLSN